MLLLLLTASIFACPAPVQEAQESTKPESSYRAWRDEILSQACAPLVIQHEFTILGSSLREDGSGAQKIDASLHGVTRFQSASVLQHQWRVEPNFVPEATGGTFEFLLDGEAYWFRMDGFVSDPWMEEFSEGIVKLRIRQAALQEVYALGLDFVKMVPDHPDFLPIGEDGIEITRMVCATLPPRLESLFSPVSSVHTGLSYFQCLAFEQKDGLVMADFVLDASPQSLLARLAEHGLLKHLELFEDEVDRQRSWKNMQNLAAGLQLQMTFEASSGILLAMDVDFDYTPLDIKGHEETPVSVVATYRAQVEYAEHAQDVVIEPMPVTPPAVDFSLSLVGMTMYLGGSIREMEAAGDLDF